MKTRKEAEARAMELFPDLPITIDNMHSLDNFAKREGFMKCWEEMQKNKQTCGFCVEPKNEVKEQPKGMVKVEKDHWMNTHGKQEEVKTADELYPNGYTIVQQEGNLPDLIIPNEPQPQEKVDELPDIYEPPYNDKRIKKYTKLLDEYSIDKGTAREIFCKGADWYKELIKATTLQDNGLREAAEKVVLKWIGKCAITAEDIEKLKKALK